jgi:uncharacterized protein YkwD
MQSCPECDEAVPADVNQCPGCGASTPTTTEATVEEPIDIEWECSACGRTHVKNSPPCSGCGHTVLDKRPVYPSDMEFSTDDTTPSRRGFLLYAGGIGLAVLGGGYLYVDGTSTPEMPDAPGQTDHASGIDLSAAETRLRERVNEEREAAGVAGFHHDESLDQGATYNTRYMVENGFGNTADMTRLLEEFGANYDEAVFAADKLESSSVPSRPIDSVESAAELGDRFATRWLASTQYRSSLVSSRYTSIGLDMHVDTNGAVYVTGVWTN